MSEEKEVKGVEIVQWKALLIILYAIASCIFTGVSIAIAIGRGLASIV